MRNTVRALASLMFASGAALANGPSPEEAVLESLLRYLLNDAKAAKTICVGGYDVEQVATVRARVKADVPTITEYSECPKLEMGSRQTAYVRIWLGAAIRVNEHEFIARGEIYRNPLNSYDTVYKLRIKDGAWTVIGAEPGVVS